MWLWVGVEWCTNSFIPQQQHGFAPSLTPAAAFEFPPQSDSYSGVVGCGTGVWGCRMYVKAYLLRRII